MDPAQLIPVTATAVTQSTTNVPPPPPQQEPSSNGNNQNPSGEDIRTIFITNLPMNTTEREMHLLFVTQKGYEFLILKTHHLGKISAFVTFSSHEDAKSAMSRVNGLLFDPEFSVTINAMMARSTSRRIERVGTKRPRDGSAYGQPMRSTRQVTRLDQVAVQQQQLVPHSTVAGSHSSVTAGALLPYPPPPQTAVWERATTIPSSFPPPLPPTILQPQLTLPHQHQQPTISTQISHSQGVSSAPPVFQERSSATVEPCNTLFVKGIGPSVTHAELVELFSSQPGFSRLKRSGQFVAFVEFCDTRSAESAMFILNGTQLKSGEGGTLAVQFAKSSMVSHLANK